MKKCSLIVSGAMLLAAVSMTYATSYSYTPTDNFMYSGNPAALERKMPVKAVDHSLKLLTKNLVTHAGVDKTDDIAHDPEFFAEYGFSYNDDTRDGGLDTDVHSGTIGMGWLTYENIAVGGMITGSVADGDAVASLESETISIAGTIYASKSFMDCMLIGTSLTFGAAKTDAHVVSVDTETDSNSFTVAPYIGGYYMVDKWSLSTTLTYAATMQDYDYLNNTNNSNSSSSMGSLIWANNVGYTFNEKFSLGINLTPNFIVHDEPSANIVRGDDLWMNVGIYGAYAFAKDLSVNLGYSYDAFNCDYNNHNVNFGMSYRF